MQFGSKKKLDKNSVSLAQFVLFSPGLVVWCHHHWFNVQFILFAFMLSKEAWLPVEVLQTSPVRRR